MLKRISRLASAAGKTRDWDIWIGLIEKDGNDGLLNTFRKNRDETAKKSVQTLRKSHLDKNLQNTVTEAERELKTSSSRTRLSKFGQKRVRAAQKQLKKRMRHASHVGGSDYAAYHDVRKTGKKVRYLIEFFEPLLKKKQRKGLKSLKRLQKQFGALNDVVASHNLLASHRRSLRQDVDPKPALFDLEKEQMRRSATISSCTNLQALGGHWSDEHRRWWKARANMAANRSHPDQEARYVRYSSSNGLLMTMLR